MSDAAGRPNGQLVLAPALVGAAVTAVLIAVAGEIASCTGDRCFGQALELVTIGVPIALVISWAVLAIFTGAWRGPVVTLGGAVVVAYLLKLATVLVTTPDPPPAWAAALVGAAGFALVAVAFLPRLAVLVRWAAAGAALAIAIWGHFAT
jgi:hypothetical protein